MISWFKKHFIPHNGNDNRPHFLRSKNIRNVIFIVLFLEIFTFLIPTLTRINTTGNMASVLPSILSNLTNEERTANKEATLTVNPILNKAAEMKANDMAEKGYFAHTSPEGKTPWYWLGEVHYEYQYAGENLAINFTDSKDVTSAWMASPTHKANIVKENYTEMGTGVASGIYEGKETIFVAQVYANPLPKESVLNTKIDTNEITKKIPNKITTDKIAPQIKTTNVLGAEVIQESPKVSEETNATFIQKMFASPRHNSNIIFFLIFGIVIFSLVLNIIIKVKHHHPDLITNALITLAIILAIVMANYLISNKSMTTTSNLDYSSENK